MSTDPGAQLLWLSPHAGKQPIDDYRRHINRKFGQTLDNSHDLQRWSVRRPHDFWLDLYGYVGLVPQLPPHVKRAFDESRPLSDVPPFFEGVMLNYAENVLTGRDPNAVALIGLRESDIVNDSGDGAEFVTWGQLGEKVRVVRSALIRSGVREGDRVAAIVSTSVWAVVLLLAASSMGAIFSSISPDMGVEGCVSRLQQIEPAILFADSDMSYKGRKTPLDEKVVEVVDKLPKAPMVFVIPITGERKTSKFPMVDDFLARAHDTDVLRYNRVPFSHPVYILYSSGTTGPPKCLVHQHGVILQLKKVALLHNSLGSKDVVFQYSSTSWVLFNILNGHMSTGATNILYDGSPLWPDARSMLKILEKFRVTYWGTSPRYLLELEASKVIPRDAYDLSALRMVTTTGATLTVDQFRWFYRVFPYVHLSSVAGGTDIVTSWIASDPSGPLYAGEMQMFALGMDVDVADAETGDSILHTGKSGELVCRTPFPSMPVFFWGEPDGAKYRATYFERFERMCVWAQHDWISVNPVTGGIVMHGRSDGVLNPSGIRFGSAEVYAISEGPSFNGEIEDSLCVGRRRPNDRDEVVFLFVKMRSGKPFSRDLETRLRGAIRAGLSPRHEPRFMIEVPEIPVTINGKKVEIVVKRILSGAKVQVSSTVANPGSLKFFEQFTGLEEPARARL